VCVCVRGTCCVDGAAGADDGAVLGHVEVGVGVAVEPGGGRAAALGLRRAVLPGGAGLVLPVHHQLDPTSVALLEVTQTTCQQTHTESDRNHNKQSRGARL